MNVSFSKALRMRLPCVGTMRLAKAVAVLCLLCPTAPFADEPGHSTAVTEIVATVHVGPGPHEIGYRNTLIAAWALAVDSKGNLYVADTVNDRIQKYDAHGTYRLTIPIEDASTSPVLLHHKYFLAVNDITTDRDDNLYAISRYRGKIYVFSEDGREIRQIDFHKKAICWVEQEGWYGDCYPQIEGLFVDVNGSIYIQETNALVKLDRKGNIENRWVLDDYYYRSVLLDKEGNLYLSRPGYRVEKYDQHGKLLAEHACGAYDSYRYGGDCMLPYFLDANGFAYWFSEHNEIIKADLSGKRVGTYATKLFPDNTTKFDWQGHMYSLRVLDNEYSIEKTTFR